MAKKKARTPAKRKTEPQPRNPQDLTLRNNNARKREIAELSAQLSGLADRVKALEEAKPVVQIEHTFPPEP